VICLTLWWRGTGYSRALLPPAPHHTVGHENYDRIFRRQGEESTAGRPKVQRDAHDFMAYSGTPMILCVSHFIFGFLRRSQTYIFSGLFNFLFFGFIRV
jgi:hypothetical protein